MTHPRTRELLDHLEVERAGVRAAVDAIPAALRERRPEPERWSAAEVLEHLGIVEGRITTLLSERIAPALASGEGAARFARPSSEKRD